MRCVNPFVRRYVDLLGLEHSVSCPCGKCVACLHNFQQQWFVRILEHSKAYPRFVYDTLTFAPKNLPLVCCPEIDDVIGEVPKSWDKHLLHYLDSDGIPCVPFPEKSIYQKWIKRGRENYFNDTGVRLNCSYFAVLEYGEKFSRPHFHLLMWGCPQDVYIKYFQEPWEQDFGFTKTKFLGYDGILDGKDVSCISRYLSKYIAKGSFESPFVKLGLAPKPFRLISKGIGAAYLQSSVFDYFRTPAAEFAKSIEILISRTAIRCRLLNLLRRRGSSRDCPFLHTSFVVRDVSRVRNAVDIDLMEGWLKPPSDKVLHHLCFYHHNGFVYILPRYYRSKLLNSYVPNLLQFTLQGHLLENSRLFYNKKLQEFAHSLGYKVKWEKVADTFAGFGRKLYNLLFDKLCTSEGFQARAAAKGRYSEMKNFYNRPLALADLY